MCVFEGTHTFVHTNTHTHTHTHTCTTFLCLHNQVINFFNNNSVLLVMALKISLYYTQTFPLSLMPNSQ